MENATPVDPNRLHPALRPLTPIWSRRWVGFPAALPPPIGRAHDIATLCDMLREPRRRLLTVTGPGGIGKTRLVLAAAEQLATSFADGAAFVALADISDPAVLLPTVARVLEVRESSGRSVRDTLFGAIRDRHLLLVLDNFEQLAGIVATADISALSEACPNLTILVTSRVPLHLHDERVFATPSLAMPAAAGAIDPDALSGFGAVALFVERARLANHGFALTAENAAAVIEICRRLDGLPLAIELAAAWVRILPPAALLARLEPRLPLLRDGAKDQPIRLQTMRNAIAWSYDLLSDEAQRFFRGLGVLVGGFTLEAAEWIADRSRGEGSPSPVDRPPSPHHPITPSPPLDLLAELIDKSLLQRTEPSGAEARFTMLETVREFARERLDEHGEAAATETAHAEHYLALAEVAAGVAGGAEREDWMRRLAVERPNLRSALDCLDQTGRADAALQMTGALWHYWYRLGDLAEGRIRLERALATAPAGVDPVLRARALRGAGVLAWQSADYERSRERLETALAAYRALDDQSGAAWVLNSLGCLFATLSDEERAERYLTESLAIFRGLGDAVGSAQLSANLGELAEAEGRHDLAIERLEAALAMWRVLGDRVGAARAQVFLGQALLARNEMTRAHAVLLDTLTIIRDIDYEQILPAALRTVSQLAARRGDSNVAARWYGAEDGLRAALGIELTPARRADHERTLAALREALGAAAFTSAWVTGRGLTATHVMAEVLADVDAAPRSGSASDDPAAVVETTLTRREHQVLALLVAGRSDRAIADALFIGQRTASTHVSAILRKLNASTRAEAAVRAVRDGLV